jgi:hypothetical protein
VLRSAGSLADRETRLWRAYKLALGMESIKRDPTEESKQLEMGLSSLGD